MVCFFSISLAIFIFISENNKGASTPTSIYFLKSTTELLEQYEICSLTHCSDIIIVNIEKI